MLLDAPCDKNQDELFHIMVHNQPVLPDFTFVPYFIFQGVSLALLFAKMSTKKPSDKMFTRKRRSLATARKWMSWRQQRSGSYSDAI